MIKGIYHSAAGMLPNYFKLVNISNNLANVTTTGYKADRRYFNTVLNNEVTQPGADGKPKSLNKLDEGVYTIYEQGSLKFTDNSLNVALNGKGFLVSEDPESGELFYTRNGRFSLNLDKQLVNSLGNPVLDDGYGPIEVGDATLAITESGDIYLDNRHKGKLMIVDFENYDVLTKAGETQYTISDDAVEIDPEDVAVHHGYVEESNVNVMHEMVEMIALNRNYESSSRALQSQDGTLRELIQKAAKF